MNGPLTTNNDITYEPNERTMIEFNQSGRNDGATNEDNSPRNRITRARVLIHTNAFTEHAQIFHLLFRNLAINYARFMPPLVRRLIEFSLLIKACLSLCLLVYIHLMFVRSPLTCLDHLRTLDNSEDQSATCSLSTDSSCSSSEYEQYHEATKPLANQRWPRMGILRVEIIPNVPPNYKLSDSYSEEYPYLYNSVNLSQTSSTDIKQENIDYTYMLLDQFSTRFKHFCDTLLIKLGLIKEEPIVSPKPKEDSYFDLDKIKHFILFYKERFVSRFRQLIQEAPSKIESLSKPDFFRTRYVMEYSLHHGMLRLPPNVRDVLNISTKLVVLDPYKHECFGNSFTHFLLDEFLGYNDILIGSFKRLSGNEPAEGYVRNVVDGSYYRFVNMSSSPSSYLAAFFAMMMFTFAVSLLLRYSHQQIFLIINEMLIMIETNIGLRISVAPLFTLILALIAVETIMSEFFGDSLTAFYVIVIVSLADHYEAVCCYSPISKRYWPWFFFLYHFSFYAYNYRFNAQYSNLALLCSWLFIQHSMIYFFHHFDLPYLLADLHTQNQTRNQQTRIRISRTPSPSNSTQSLTTSSIIPSFEDESLVNTTTLNST